MHSLLKKFMCNCFFATVGNCEPKELKIVLLPICILRLDFFNGLLCDIPIVCFK